MRLKMTLLYRIKCFFPKMFEFKYRHSATQRLCTVAARSDQFPTHLKFFILAYCLQCKYLRYDFKNEKHVLYSRKLEIRTRCQDD